MSKRALIYARVSYDDQARSGGRNLESQIEDGRAYCQEKGYRIVAELAEDDRGASGAEWDLPKLNQALDMARAGEFDVLVVRELDRFARGLAKQLVIEGEFKRLGVAVEYILAEYDDSPEGKLNKHIRAVIAEFEREKINQRMSRGRRNIVRNGKVMLHGQPPPYGYRVENRMLTIYEPEAKIVRLIFTWYVVGDENGQKLSINGIAVRLTEMKVPTWGDIHGIVKKKRGWGEWEAASVSNILNNETYAGVWHYGKRGNARDYWLSTEVPAIVSREAWEKAQERRAYNRRMSKRNTKAQYLVGRRVTCGKCGKGMSGRRKTRNRYYHCRGAYKLVGVNCDSKYFRADHVDAAVWEKIKEWLQDPEVLEQSLERVKEKLSQKNKPLLDRLAVVDDLEAAAEPGIFVLQRVVAVGAGGNNLFNAVTFDSFYIPFRLHLEKVLVAQSAGGLAATALPVAEDAEVNTGKLQYFGHGAGYPDAPFLQRPGTAHPEKGVRVTTLIEQLDIETFRPVCAGGC